MSDETKTADAGISAGGMPLDGSRTPDPTAPDVLLLNPTGGFWTATHLEPLPATRNEREPYKPHRLVVYPGLCFVDGGIWAQLRANNKGVDLAIQEGRIRELGDAKGFARQDAGAREDQVLNSGHLATLEALAAACKGPASLLDAFSDQIEVLKKKEANEAEQRRTQRRARRAAARSGGFA